MTTVDLWPEVSKSVDVKMRERTRSRDVKVCFYIESAESWLSIQICHGALRV